MKRKFITIIAILFCILALNKIFYDTYTKTVDLKNNRLIINKESMEPQKLFCVIAGLIEKQYIEEDLNHQDWGRWTKRYKNKIKTDDDMKVAVDTMIASLNEPYTHFLSREEFKNLNTSIKSKIYGIGVNIYNDSGKITVFSVMPGTPAEKAGLKPTDIIMKVGKTECNGKKIDQVADLIRGAKDSTVTITLLRGKKTLVKTLTREEIKIKTIETKIYDDIGYINLTSFLSSDMKSELDSALEKTKDCKGLIIDLRWNTGGLLDNAVRLAETFIDSGTIVSVVSRSGKKNVIAADNNTKKIHKPVVILINEASASASEIFSGAMKDYNRATLIGHKSFGKGMVQSVIPLPNETGINLTIAKYLTPKEHDINNKGIEPHIVVDQDVFSKDASKDKQLNAAKNVLHKLINDADVLRISNNM